MNHTFSKASFNVRKNSGFLTATVAANFFSEELGTRPLNALISLSAQELCNRRNRTMSFNIDTSQYPCRGPTKTWRPSGVASELPFASDEVS